MYEPNPRDAEQKFQQCVDFSILMILHHHSKKVPSEIQETRNPAKIKEKQTFKRIQQTLRAPSWCFTFLTSERGTMFLRFQ